MSSDSPQQQALSEAARLDKARMEQAYGIALPALGTEYASINKAMSEGGEPGYVKSAYGEARTGMREGALQSQLGALRASQAQKKGAVMGGNVGALNPAQMGGDLANALFGSRVSEAAGSLDQMNKLMGSSLGQAQQTGSGALQATGNQLASISGMRGYNQGYAALLGALNLGGSVYGGFQQQPGGLDPRLGSSVSPWERTQLAAGAGSGGW